MSFMFNFNAEEEDYNDGTSNCGSSIIAEKKKKNVVENSLPALEVTDFYDDTIISKLSFKFLTLGEHSFHIVDTKCAEELLKEDDSLRSSQPVLDALNSHSDLVPGTYEGGLTIWECAIDLVKFLSSPEAQSLLEIKHTVVLELGCGAGLPGLFCLKSGADRVDFQDYNVDVLKLLTQPNVTRNASSQKCHYYAGDWGNFNMLAAKNNLKYDIILTAETIYNPDNYSKLVDIFNTTLKENGTVLLAAKTYYFGVGGSMDTFIDYVNKSRSNLFTFDVLQTIKEAVPRQIISLRRRSEKGFIDKKQKDKVF